MAKKLVIQHDLSKLDPLQLQQYLREVSEFIGLDPDLNGLDTIWMDNESGPGRSLVVYARRGTAEILRNNRGIEVSTLTDKMVNGSIVFTATGKDNKGRQEIATGSKYLASLTGKALDDAIMSASTRALRRLTMQFTSLGILDESEVKAVIGDASNPASNAQPVGAPVVFPAPQATYAAYGTLSQVTENIKDNPANKPILEQMDKLATLSNVAPAAPAPVVSYADVVAEGVAALAARPVGQTAQERAEATQEKEITRQNIASEEPAKPKRARKSKNSVSLEGPEPEVVSAPAPVSATVETPQISVPLVPAAAPISVNVPTQAVPAVPVQANPVSDDFPGKPSQEQMAEYRKKVLTYTSELPSSENLGSVQKMRAFITHMSGTAPQFMTTDQWQEQLAWFESFVEKNKIKGLVNYINDSLGVK